MRLDVWNVLICLLLLLCTVAYVPASAAGSNAAQFLKLQEQTPCQPWTVEPQDRCSYVIEHADACYPDGGWQAYLRVHYCTFTGAWEWVSLLLLLLAAVLCFFVLLTVSERFFCPALELISEYLRLPPAVAGATLLSFGNGAPDIFTQVAAVGQGGSAAVGMALAEPLGGGLFTTNIVFGLVVLVASRAANVSIQRCAFMKDVAFYLTSLLMISAILRDGKVVMWEAASMALMYVAYVCVTFWVSRHDQPVRADMALHEVPQEEGVDIPNSCCGYSDDEQDFTTGHVHGHMDSHMLDMANSTQLTDMEAAAAAAAAAAAEAAVARYNPSVGLSPRSAYSTHSDATVRITTPSPVMRNSSRRWHNIGPLDEPLLPSVEEADRSASGAWIAPDSQSSPAAATLDIKSEEGSATAAADGKAAVAAAAPSGEVADMDEGLSPAAAAAAVLPPAGLGSVRALRKCRTFAEGSRVTVVVPPSDAGSTGGLLTPTWHHFSPRALSEGGALTPERTFRRCTSQASGGSIFAAASRGSTEHVMPLVHQLQEHHQAEQQELLEKQYEEHLALMELHEEAQGIKSSAATAFKHKMQHPLMLLLSCTMPRVGTGHGHHYQRWRAMLLPITAPLTLFVAAPDLLPSVGAIGMAYSLLCAAVGSAIIYTTYPSSNVPRKSLKGVFAVMAFVQSICWLNIAASSMVAVCVVFGVIFGVKPALLGATVLAYGNSVPDLINNLALARDGFPSMAIAACFASPLFVLMVGVSSAMAYGATLSHGVLQVPVDGPLIVMLGFGVVNLLQYLVTVPLLYRYAMTRKMAATSFLYYACFNVVYGLAITGVIHINPRIGLQ